MDKPKQSLINNQLARINVFGGSYIPSPHEEKDHIVKELFNEAIADLNAQYGDCSTEREVRKIIKNLKAKYHPNNLNNKGKEKEMEEKSKAIGKVEDLIFLTIPKQMFLTDEFLSSIVPESQRRKSNPRTEMEFSDWVNEDRRRYPQNICFKKALLSPVVLKNLFYLIQNGALDYADLEIKKVQYGKCYQYANHIRLDSAIRDKEKNYAKYALKEIFADAGDIFWDVIANDENIIEKIISGFITLSYGFTSDEKDEKAGRATKKISAIISMFCTASIADCEKSSTNTNAIFTTLRLFNTQFAPGHFSKDSIKFFIYLFLGPDLIDYCSEKFLDDEPFQVKDEKYFSSLAYKNIEMRLKPYEIDFIVMKTKEYLSSDKTKNDFLNLQEIRNNVEKLKIAFSIKHYLLELHFVIPIQKHIDRLEKKINKHKKNDLNALKVEQLKIAKKEIECILHDDVKKQFNALMALPLEKQNLFVYSHGDDNDIVDMVKNKVSNLISSPVINRHVNYIGVILRSIINAFRRIFTKGPLNFSQTTTSFDLHQEMDLYNNKLIFPLTSQLSQ